jgi:hypothetical protein
VRVLCLKESTMLRVTLVNRNFTLYVEVQVVDDTFVY